MPAQRIKVGLLINNFFVPEWIYEMLKKIVVSDYATISLIIKKQKAGVPLKPQEGFQHIVYSLYRKLENKVVKVRPNAFSLRNVSDLIESVPVLEVLSIRRQTVLKANLAAI